MGRLAAGTWGSLVQWGFASLLSRYTGCLALAMAAAEPPQSPDTRIVSKPTIFLSRESTFWPQAWRSRHARSNRKYVRTKFVPQATGKVPGDQSSPSCLQLCDFSRQGTALPPILIPRHAGDANSAARASRREPSRVAFPSMRFAPIAGYTFADDPRARPFYPAATVGTAPIGCPRGSQAASGPKCGKSQRRCLGSCRHRRGPPGRNDLRWISDAR